ncbi:MAG: hypothetical protein H0X34_16850 [Chthoniobacterales bacterium]|nr:hypothetical protein [Chthoniobacterales bacterium]
MGSAPPSRHEVFQQVWQTVKDKFFDPKLRGVDWVAMKQRYGKEAEAADSPEEFASTVNRMLAELKTSHTEYYTREEPEYYQLAGIFWSFARDKFQPFLGDTAELHGLAGGRIVRDLQSNGERERLDLALQLLLQHRAFPG